ncbi:hypothetical protein CF336_g6442 [Tilletia laevis]|uniref:Endonuclease/exonuclease/phosphatase domain-containing protein n=1 Tax=Tilletia caries TaxID=13290 RepID=A0A177TKE8_9BASI|nr:hypothetical protein CF336_g6442 [Tilletia laevis]KAE8192465.1 hypothetical protein CF335_g5825 [Tilletia laevis]KAE8237874.1 hypothetical protein A4X03_0g9016 [Tilletia caries]
MATWLSHVVPSSTLLSLIFSPLLRLLGKHRLASLCSSSSFLTLSLDPTPVPHADTLLTTSSLRNLSVVTLNCGAGGLSKRLREFAPSARSILHSADIICLQEAHVTLTITFDDTNGIESFLGTIPRSPFRGLLTADTGILIRSSTFVVERFAHGKHWAHVLLSLPPLLDHETPDGRIFASSTTPLARCYLAPGASKGSFAPALSYRLYPAPAPSTPHPTTAQ